MPSPRHALRNENDSTRWSGQVGWGWRVTDEGVVERDEYEERVVMVARHMRASGYALREIAEFLRGLGVVGRRGTAIGVTRIFEMIHGGRRKPRRSTPPT